MPSSPGQTEVLDRATGALVDCDETTCPNAIDGVNHAPFASFGGWSGAINANATRGEGGGLRVPVVHGLPEQSNVDVTLGATGFNPYRISQFENLADLDGSGMSEAAAQNYLGAIEDSLEQPEHGPRPAHPQDQAVRAGRARHRPSPVPGR